MENSPHSGAGQEILQVSFTGTTTSWCNCGLIMLLAMRSNVASFSLVHIFLIMDHRISAADDVNTPRYLTDLTSSVPLTTDNK